ncbi:hypothetical protein THAOC_32384, partial [Thalassiosira oceanica]
TGAAAITLAEDARVRREAHRPDNRLGVLQLGHGIGGLEIGVAEEGEDLVLTQARGKGGRHR